MASKAQQAAQARFAKQARAKGNTKIGRRAKSTARQTQKAPERLAVLALCWVWASRKPPRHDCGPTRPVTMNRPG
jgi:hypothetical protein